MSTTEMQGQAEQSTPTPEEIPAKTPKPKGRGKGERAPKGRGAKTPAKPTKQAAPKAPKGKGAEEGGKGEQASKAAPALRTGGEGTLFRIVRVKTPKGGERTITVTRAGEPDAASRLRGLIPPAKTWTEIRAGSFAEANALFREGKGTKVRAQP